MEGVIVHYRQNRHDTYGDQLIIKPAGLTTKEAASALKGKTVIWNSGKKDMSGKVASAHGNSGCIRVIFETGMPGQALGQKVKIQ